MSMFPRRFSGLILFSTICLIFFTMPASAQIVANRYILLLNDPPVASRFETRAQMESAAGIQYKNQVEARQRGVLAELASRNIGVTGRVSTLLNAIFVIAPASRVSELQAIPGVAAVRPARRYQLLLNRATQLMNGPAAWTALGGQASAGNGVKIAIIDTGIDQTHSAFQDSTLQTPAGFPICSGFSGNCSDFTNSKVIVARSYVRQLAGFKSKDPVNLPDDTSVAPNPATSQPDDYTPRDRVGHGTATASAAAANQNSGTVTFTGMAPKAYLGNYKVTGAPYMNDGATDDVLIKAVDDALNDKMDVVSISLGAPAAAGPLDTGAACGLSAGQPCDPLAFAFEAAAKANMVVVAAAGNSGSDAVFAGGNYPTFNSISTPSDAPSVISVGATTNSHAITPTVGVSAASAPANVKSLSAQLGDSIFFPSVQGANSGPLVDVAQLGNDGFACTALPGGSLNGAYALIENGAQCSFDVQATNAQLAGAVGLVYYMANSGALTPPSGLGPGGANFLGPAATISNADGLALKSYIDANPNQSVTIDAAGMEMDLTTFSQLNGISPPIAPNQLASYSSFGPAPDGSIKPDMVATGGLDGAIAPAPGVYVAAQSYDPNGVLYSVNRYAAADGTSFATPLVAGAAALVKQAHPDYSAAQIKSALVNTAAQDTTTDDGHADVNGIRQSPVPVDVQWLGGGRLDAGAALKSTITVAPATISLGYVRANSLPVNKALTVTNKGTASVTVAVAVVTNHAASGATVATDKASLTLAANASTTLNVTLSGTVPPAGSYSGAVTLSVSGAVTQRVPYLFLVPDGVPYNFLPFQSALQGTAGQDAGSVGVQILDRYGVPVIGVPVAFSVSPKNAVTFQSVTGEPACSPNNSSAATCATDNYGSAYAEVVMGPTVSTPTITATASNTPFQFTGVVLPAAVITPGQVLDNAAFLPTVAPGSIAAIKGSNLMDTSNLVNTAQGYDLIPPQLTSFPLNLDFVSVSFDVPAAGISVPAPVVAVSSGQINVQVPWELKGQTSAKVKVIIDEAFGTPSIYSAVVDAPLSDYTPAFFTNSGNVADALDGNYHVITSSNPAIRGQVVSLYANGLGPVSNTPADGFGAVGIGSTTTTPCVVRIGGETLSASQVGFCGLAPGLAIYQVNAQVPADLSPGNQPITVTIGGKTSPAGIVIPVQ